MQEKREICGKKIRELVVQKIAFGSMVHQRTSASQGLCSVVYFPVVEVTALLPSLTRAALTIGNTKTVETPFILSRTR